MSSTSGSLHDTGVWPAWAEPGPAPPGPALDPALPPASASAGIRGGQLLLLPLLLLPQVGLLLLCLPSSTPPLPLPAGPSATPVLPLAGAASVSGGPVGF